MGSLMRTTPIGYLPGVFCAVFYRKTVYCSWKGGPYYTLLFYYLDDPDNPEVPDGHFRDLGCLEFDYVVNDIVEAQALAKASWDRYREQILAVNGDRLYVTDLESDTSDSS